MIRVFIPENKRKQNKGNLARGFWRNEAGHTYYDYVSVKDYNQSIEAGYYSKLFYNYLETLKASYSQEAIFYTVDKVGYCYYNKNKIEVLKNRIYKEVTRVDLKRTIQEVLRQYSGCTVYQEAGQYYIEVYHNKGV